VRLRRRLNTVLLQWLLLFVVVAGAVWVLSLPRLRRNLVDDRLLLARTIAHSFDVTISSSLQTLGRLSAELPPSPVEAAARLRAFRFQSPFGEASYVVDGRGAIVAADPADARPLPAAWLGYHEAVTPLVQTPGSADRHVIAIVQPFTRPGGDYYLVSEMNPRSSFLNTFLKDLDADPTIHVVVIDENGRVVASPDSSQVYEVLPGSGVFSDRIRAHRPLVVEDGPAAFTPGASPQAALTVMAPLQFATWGVVVQQPTAQAFSGLRATGQGLLLAGLGLGVMGVLVARTLSRSVVSPIQRLSRQADAMRGGDLSSPIAVAGDHEIEALARTLDEARSRLRATLDELQAFNVRLEEQVAARTRVIVQQDEQRKALVRRLLNATEDERRRLARELHDEIAQLLTVIQLSLHRIDLDTPEMRRASELLTRTQQEIHRIIYDLRPSLLDDLGLPTAMKSYAEDNLVRHGLSVNLEIDEGLPPRPEIETVIFRIYQELVTNILRHAKAEQVSIELYERDGTLVLAVEDDGQGFDPEAKSDGAGVTGMRERAALVNGTICFDTEPGMGTHVVVEIPLQ
jgi:signal transduction histidine kinase